MLWMDGKGSDSAGPCAQDNSSACGTSVVFSNFSVADIGSEPHRIKSPDSSKVVKAMELELANSEAASTSEPTLGDVGDVLVGTTSTSSSTRPEAPNGAAAGSDGNAAEML